MYIATLLSTGATDRTIYKDSAVTGPDGQQVSYVECATPHGKSLNPYVLQSTRLHSLSRRRARKPRSSSRFKVHDATFPFHVESHAELKTQVM